MKSLSEPAGWSKASQSLVSSNATIQQDTKIIGAATHPSDAEWLRRQGRRRAWSTKSANSRCTCEAGSATVSSLRSSSVVTAFLGTASATLTLRSGNSTTGSEDACAAAIGSEAAGRQDRSRSEPEQQWKTRSIRIRQLFRLGINRRDAILHGLVSHGCRSRPAGSKTPVINQALSLSWLKQQGLPSLAEQWSAIHYPTTVR